MLQEIIKQHVGKNMCTSTCSYRANLDRELNNCKRILQQHVDKNMRTNTESYRSNLNIGLTFCKESYNNVSTRTYVRALALMAPTQTPGKHLQGILQ